MALLFPEKIFITGTDTGVGKTFAAAVLMAGLDGEYWKPVQSGLEEITDTDWVKEKTGLPQSRFHAEAYRLREAMSPHASAAKEGIRIDLERFPAPRMEDPSRTLIVEGAGGIMVPLNERHFMLDLMRRLDFPVLLVASSRLGTINHTLLTVDKLRTCRLSILGVVLNGVRNEDNRRAIEEYGNVHVLGEMEPIQKINRKILKAVFRRSFS
jgi:dethiobiotin synthase